MSNQPVLALDFVSEFRAEAVLVTGGPAEAWRYFAPSLSRSLSIPVLRGTLGSWAALQLFIFGCSITLFFDFFG